VAIISRLDELAITVIINFLSRLLELWRCTP